MNEDATKMPQIKKAKDVKPGDWHFESLEPYTKVIIRKNEVELHTLSGRVNRIHPESLIELQSEQSKRRRIRTQG